MPQPPFQTAALPLRAALPSLLLLAGLFYANFVSRVIMAPLLALVEHEFGINHASAGGLFLFVAGGMSLSMTCSGFVAGRLGHRRTVLLSTALLGTFLIGAGLSRSFFELRALLLATGLAGGLYFPSAVATITTLLEPRHWGRGLAVHEMAPNLAFVTVPLLATALAEVLPWRGVFLVFGSLALGLGGLFLAFGRGGDARGAAPRAQALREVVLHPAFPVLVALFSLAVAASFGPYSMLPLYLTTERGVTPETANALLTVSRVAGPLMALATGFVVDRIGARRTAALSLASSGLMTLLLGPLSGPWLAAAVVLQPTLSVCFFAAGLTAMSQTYGQGVRNVAVSLVVPLGILLGSGATPTALGWFGDQGSFATGFVVLGVCILGGVPLLRLLRFAPQEA
jgi:NNP family nitrate/nitrite transporter-like MFS transporter